MALVSYDVSDASGSEDEGAELAPTMILLVATNQVEEVAPVQNLAEEADPELSTESKIFSVLPTPKSKSALMDSSFSKLLLNKPLSTTNKPTKKSVQIGIPSLSDFEEDLPRPTTRKVTASTKGSGLFDILPAPKNTGMAATLRLMPDSLKRTGPSQKPALKPPARLVPRQVGKKPPVLSAPPVDAPDDDSDEETTSDFFSLSKPVEIQAAPVELPVVNTAPLVEMPETTDPEPEADADSYTTGDFVSFSPDDLTLDDEAIQKLCGGSKRKRTAMQAQLIDVAQSDIAPDKNEWLMKALTEQKRTRSHNPKNSGGPSSQQKRKHHITYLAFQAKEQEQELQNQWANNKMTKKQTQSKYGF